MTQIVLIDQGENVKVPRVELVAALRKRDGKTCQYPDCNGLMDFSLEEGPQAVTIDHWKPQAYGKANGWTREEIWDLSNLKLMHRKCNAKKGDRVPDDNGILPPKVERTWKNRRAKRLQRPEICVDCQSGRLLGQDEWCNACGSGPNPGRFQKWRQETVKDCDHDLFYCVACTVWFPEYRRSALDAILTGGNGYE